MHRFPHYTTFYLHTPASPLAYIHFTLDHSYTPDFTPVSLHMKQHHAQTLKSLIWRTHQPYPHPSYIPHNTGFFCVWVKNKIIGNSCTPLTLMWTVLVKTRTKRQYVLQLNLDDSQYVCMSIKALMFWLWDIFMHTLQLIDRESRFWNIPRPHTIYLWTPIPLLCYLILLTH